MSPYSNQIRLAKPDEALTVSALLEESFAEYRPLYTPAGYAATAISDDEVAARISQGPLWIALLDDRVVGTVSVVPIDGSLYIRGMAVLPTARGSKIGEMLLTHVQEFAISQGISRMFLSTTPFLARAIRLYEAFGFCRMAEGSKDLFGTPLFTMEKMID
jgi:ribosomal protein S18 acetylase RimI-like enzyme